MVYELFLNTVKEQLEQALGEGYELFLRKVPKNNGIVLDGLCISKKGSSVAPAIYLNSCYSQYLSGRPVTDIVAEIEALYRANEDLPVFDCSSLTDFESMKPRIICRLINSQWNELLLRDIPHIPWLDLALVFHLALKEDEEGLMTALIQKEHLDIWGITQKELYQAAMENGPRRFPPIITSMDHLLEELAGSPVISAALPLYVLTNAGGVGGASCLLYPNVLKNFAEGTETDLIILPSSIHEVLLLPYETPISFKELSRLVSFINRSEVPEQDRLSDQVYLYTRSTDSVTIAPQNNALVC